MSNFNFTNAAKQTLFMAQTETPYWCDARTPFLQHFHIKTIILPRQARDKHRKS